MTSATGDGGSRNTVNDPVQLLDQEKLASLVSKYTITFGGCLGFVKCKV